MTRPPRGAASPLDPDPDLTSGVDLRWWPSIIGALTPFAAGALLVWVALGG